MRRGAVWRPCPDVRVDVVFVEKGGGFIVDRGFGRDGMDWSFEEGQSLLCYRYVLTLRHRRSRNLTREGFLFREVYWIL